MTKNLLWALIAGVATGAVFSACGETGGESITCTSSASCLEGEVCAAGVCVVSCEDDTACPAAAPTCAEFTATGETLSGNVCQCATDAECNSDGVTGLVCNTFGLCTPSCAEGADGTAAEYTCPTGFTCNASGKCDEDEVTPACDPQVATIGAAGGPDTCAYGEDCVSSSGTPACVDVPHQTTGEGANAPGTWDTAAMDAPVILAVTGTVNTNTTAQQCNPAGSDAIEVAIDYYAPNGYPKSTTFADYDDQVRWINRTTGLGAGWRPTSQFEATMASPANSLFGTITVGIACDAVVSADDRSFCVQILSPDGASNVVCGTAQ